MENHKNTINYSVRRAFAENTHFIVDENTVWPEGREATTLVVISEVTGFSCVDTRLHNDSADYPVTLIPGIQLNGTYRDIEVDSGYILCILRD